MHSVYNELCIITYNGRRLAWSENAQEGHDYSPTKLSNVNPQMHEILEIILLPVSQKIAKEYDGISLGVWHSSTQ